MLNIGRVLVIDDDPIVLSALEVQLSKLGLKEITLVEAATDALEQFLSANSPPFDIVICDLQMPVMDGIEFVRRLADMHYPGALILLSGENVRTLQAASLLASKHKLNILGTLTKPVALNSLRETLGTFEREIVDLRGLREQIMSKEDLTQAIEQGQLILYYQPKISLADGSLKGLEAVVRWQHPRHGLINPDQFIGVAENYGLIDKLTFAVLDQAFRQMAQWRRVGKEIKVSVNVSMDNLSSLDFPEMVLSKLSEHNIDPKLLVLEITESRLMLNPDKVLDIVTRLKLKRIGLALDDFGTGHSSLAQLRDLPFDELKLDRSFVHDSTADAVRAAILHGSIQMADQLGMVWVAEGVEDLEDWIYLRQFDDGLLQGYFIGRPMRPEDLDLWQKEWQERYRALAKQRE